MIKIENTEIFGLQATVRGMRNPLNSWDKTDSAWNDDSEYIIGENDMKLMLNLAKAGPSHSKYRRMITVYADITAPLYWWKEFDTYKVGTVANSCSTMHKIADKEFELSDFSYEHILGIGLEGSKIVDDEFRHDNCLFKIWEDQDGPQYTSPFGALVVIIKLLNTARDLYLETKDKVYWWQMIQLLPTSYNQKRTVMMNYEVLANIYHTRKGHKLDEWNDFIEWIETLPYSSLIKAC